MPAVKTTGRLGRHSYGHDASYKGHRDPAAEAKTCEACDAYKPLTSFKRIASRGQGPDAYAAICKQCCNERSRENAKTPASNVLPFLPSAESLATVDDETIETIFGRLRWPNGVYCPRCGLPDPYRLERANRHWYYGCRDEKCKYHFSLTAGTPFSGLKVPLRTALCVLATVQRNRGALVIYRLAKERGINYQVAYCLVGKSREILQNGFEGVSAFRGYQTDRKHGVTPAAPRRALGLVETKTCIQCREDKDEEDFALRTGAAGKWGLRVSTCKSCLATQHGQKIKASRAQRRVDDENTPIVQRSATELLNGPTAYPKGVFWWNTRSWWSAQEKADLLALVSAGAKPEAAANVLGRSPSSIAWYARDIAPSLPPEWSRLIAPKRVLVAPRVRLNYPYIAKEHPSDNDLLRVNDLVPRAFPEHMRADICQSIMLAMYEGDVTLAEVEANRSKLTWFAKRWRGQQQPYQEVQVEDRYGDDDRAYYEVSASREYQTDRLNDARRVSAVYVDHYEPTQIDDVFASERRAVIRSLHGSDLREVRQVDEMLVAGEIKVRDIGKGWFKVWDRVRSHARRRIGERFGIWLDERKAQMLLEFCRHRKPEQRDSTAELHVLESGKISLPLVYDREKDDIISVLPAGGGLGRGNFDPMRI